MFKSALPGMDDIMRQSRFDEPIHSRGNEFSMEQNQPGLSNFMNDFGGQPPSPRQPTPIPLPIADKWKLNIRRLLDQNERRNVRTRFANIDSILSNLNKDNKSINVKKKGRFLSMIYNHCPRMKINAAKVGGNQTKLLSLAIN